MNRHVPPPEFAMSFTPEAVLLEQRNGPGWRPLGKAPFAGREMTARLAALRDMAGAAPGDLDTVVVIPDDQILYTTVTVPVGSDTPAAIARALEAMTPYPADDLAFDWCPSETGDIETLRVAAVARRTLEEAEDFARAQGFLPAGFVARPDDARFEGQPDFGAGRAADSRFMRQPFSEPDLTLARVTHPVLAEPAADRNATPAAAMAAAPVVSRIVPHVAPRAAAAPPLPVAAHDTAVAAPSGDVIRHGEPRAPGAPRPLQPRAQAVHDRARQARAIRATRAGDEPAPSPALIERLRRLDPGRLPVLMGLLVVAFLAVLIWFGGEPLNRPDGAGGQVATAPVSSSGAPVPTQDEPGQNAQSPVVAATLPEAAIPDAATPEARLPEAPGTAAEPGLAAPGTPATAATGRVQVEPAPPGPSAASSTAEPGSGPDARQGGAAPQAVARPEAPADGGDDPLARALAEAMRDADYAAPISAATLANQFDQAPRRAGPAAPGAAPASTSPPAAAPAAATRDPASRLASSARPPRVAPVRVVAPARTDARPAVPANPRPYAQRARSEPVPPAATRPPERPAAAPSAPASRPSPAASSAAPSRPAPAPTVAPAASARSATGAARPPSRPERRSSLEEGSAAEDALPTRLTRAERQALTDLLRDLRTAQATAAGLSPAERGAVLRLADARPTRKPVAVGAVSQRAVRDAVAAAVADGDAAAADRPASRAGSAPATTAGELGRSARPTARPGGSRAAAPGGDPGPGSPSLSSGAINQALAAAVSESTSRPGAVPLTALRSSALPPRRAGAAGLAEAPAAETVTAAAAPIASLAPTPEDLRAAAQAQSEEAAIAEQRRQDAELQAQAEARARARAAQDAQAEAQARAQAEARARAQAEAEAQAAAARQQRYAPPEAENEPDVAAAIPDGRTPTTAGNAATVKDGIQINRTQIIGTIGAGKASRALVRLSNGRVLTLRLGDKINGGTITDIGDSRITFVKAGQAQALSVLGGR